MVSPGTRARSAACSPYGGPTGSAWKPRNEPGSFWLAAADPGAAAHAVTGAEPLAALSAVALLSDGASRLADRFLPGQLGRTGRHPHRGGPGGPDSAVCAAEESDPAGERWPRGKIHDDATAALWKMTAAFKAAND